MIMETKHIINISLFHEIHRFLEASSTTNPHTRISAIIK